MYTTILSLSGEKFKGTLDMEVLKKTQEELMKLDKKITLGDLFIRLSKQDMDCIFGLIIQSIVKEMNIDDSEIADVFVKEKDESIRAENLINSFEFINELLEKCMPKDKKQEESEFIDIPVYKAEDWDLPYMQFLWETTMDKKTSFWDVTPKDFFEQINVFKEVNEIENEEVEWL